MPQNAPRSAETAAKPEILGLDRPSFRSRATLAALKRLPRRPLARWLGRITRIPLPRRLRRPILGALARALRIDLSEAVAPIDAYRSFEALFTRRLRAGARPKCDAQAILSPVDGTLAAQGRVHEGTLVQAKGLTYGLERLLTRADLARQLERGWYGTFYLSPRDYHRVHSPFDWLIDEIIHVPGNVLPVYPASVLSVADLFADNERIVFIGRSARGLRPLACVMVAAFGVGNMRVPWFPGIATNRPFRHAITTHQCDRPLDAGDELGIFALGSTVIAIAPEDMAIQARLGSVRCRDSIQATPGDTLG